MKNITIAEILKVLDEKGKVRIKSFLIERRNGEYVLWDFTSEGVYSAGVKRSLGEKTDVVLEHIRDLLKYYG